MSFAFCLILLSDNIPSGLLLIRKAKKKIIRIFGYLLLISSLLFKLTSLSTFFSPYYKKLLILIIVSTALRIFAASFTELGNDEVYYWTYARHLQWNYFDHPPMVGVWIKFFTANLALEKFEFFIRLGSIFSCVVSTLLLFHLVKKIHSEKAGWYAACLYNASIYASVLTGLFILPDSPQMIFWCSSLYFLMLVVNKPERWSNWLLFGLCAGLCIMSKVHGIFLWFGFGLYILCKERDFFKKPQLYVSAFLTTLIISPILFWNISNNFITYRFHSERVVSNIYSFNFFGLFREIFGEIIYTNPFNFIIIFSAIVAWRKNKINRLPSLILYNFIAIPMIAIFIIFSFFGDTLPHWTGPAYITLIPIASVYLCNKYPDTFFPKSIKWALALLFIVLTVGVL
ncbi:MAG: glycosyltransferase family 39 protein, partial [Thermoproteota archaeon]|nr:glycosyltransferase family 39 protein [Thermoproteota archaeon]